MALNLAQNVQQDRKGNVLLLWLDNPPVNALGHALREGIAAGIAVAAADARIAAVVLLARGRTFPAGADISEFGKPARAPTLPDLCNLIEACPKPVIAALHGTALGGGLELAMAAHYRIALQGTRLGLPEVGLGILPGAGGTQRLPRLIGGKRALQLMLSGQPIEATAGLAMGLLDQIVETDLPDAAVQLATKAMAQPLVATRDRRDGFRDPAAFFKAVTEARKTVSSNPLPGPAKIVDCVEAAQLLPFDQGLSFERAAFADLVATPEAEALRHLFFAERRAAKRVGATATPRPVATATILGAGDEAVDLALRLVAIGVEVTLAEQSKSALVPGLEKIAKTLDQDHAAGALSADEREQRWALVVPDLTGSIESLGDMLFVTGSYAQLDAALPELPLGADMPVVTLGRLGVGGRWALGLEMGAGGLSDAVADQRKLVEVIIGQDSAETAVATLLALLRRLGLGVVQANGAAIGPELIRSLRSALLHLEDQYGAAPILDLLQCWGMAGSDMNTGPARRDLYAGLAAPVLGALANAGLRLLGEGRAQRPSDIDLLMCLGHGFPRHGGGPMLWAQRRGALVLRDDLRYWAQDEPELYTPAQLLDALIHDGIAIKDLNDA